MIEPIDGMPAGTTGLHASGKLTKEDYVEVLEPALSAAVASGEVRLLFVLESFVTDVEWIAKATRAFAWVAPGELEVFSLAEEGEARTWVAG